MAKVSKTGYKRNSKDKNEPALVIPSNNITMRDVDFPVFGIDDMGYSQIMYPGMDYSFPGDFVYEVPMAQSGGDISIPDLSNKGWLSKYQKGGTRREPIYVDSPDDPRYRAYRDSLDLHNMQIEKYPNHKFVPFNLNKGIDKYSRESFTFRDENSGVVNAPIGMLQAIYDHHNIIGNLEESAPYYKKPVQPVEVRKGPQKLTPKDGRFSMPTPELSTNYAQLPIPIEQTFGSTSGVSTGPDIKTKFKGFFNTDTGEWSIKPVDEQPVNRYTSVPEGFQKGGWLQKYQGNEGSSQVKPTSNFTLPSLNPQVQQSADYAKGWDEYNKGVEQWTDLLAEKERKKGRSLTTEEKQRWLQKAVRKTDGRKTEVDPNDPKWNFLFKDSYQTYDPEFGPMTVMTKPVEYQYNLTDLDKKKQKIAADTRRAEVSNSFNKSLGDVNEFTPARMKRASQNANDQVALEILGNKPQGDRTRVEWLNSLTPEERSTIERSQYAGKLDPDFSSQFSQGLEKNLRNLDNLMALSTKPYGLYRASQMENDARRNAYLNSLRWNNDPLWVNPDYTPEEATNASALGVLSPLMYPTNLVTGAITGDMDAALQGQRSKPLFTDYRQPEFASAMSGLYEGLYDPLNAVGIGLLEGADIAGNAARVGNYLTTQTPLKNAYKYNPWAFKPNPEAYYRGIGRSGLDDALESGVLRSNRKGNFGDDLYVSSSFDEADFYANNRMPWTIDKNGKVVDDLIKGKGVDTKKYFAEIPKQNANVTPYHINNTQFISKEAIPIDNIKLLKEDWLKGYKQINTPKQLPGSGNADELIDLWRIQERGARPMSELAAEGKLGPMFQNEKAIQHFKDREKYFGQWFTKDKADFDFYKADREFLDPEVIQLQVPKSRLAEFQNYDKSLSRAADREFVIPLEQQKLFTPKQLPGSADDKLIAEKIGYSLEIPKNNEIKNINYFQQLLDNTSYSAKDRKFLQGVINSVKKQNNLASNKQFKILQGLKSGNSNYGKKGYNLISEEILKLPDEEILNKTGRSKEDWEAFIDAKPERYRKALEDTFNSAYTPTAEQLVNVEAGKKRLLDFYGSNEYNKRLQDALGISYDEALDYQNKLTDAVNRTKPRFVQSRNLGTLESDAMAYTAGVDASGTRLAIDFSNTGLNRPDAKYLASHEFGHTSLYDSKTQKLLENLPELKLDPETLKLWESEAIKPGGKTYSDLIKYYSNPDEARQRGINAILFSKEAGISIDDLVDMPYNQVVRLNSSGKIPSDILSLRQLYDQKELKSYLKKLYTIAAPTLMVGAAAVMSGDDPPQQKHGGWLSKYQDGGDMPFGLPLKSANPGSPWAYESPQANGYLLPDPNRPELLNTGASEYKIGIDDLVIPTIVNGQYMSPDDAYARYMLTGESYNPEDLINPEAYSRFYDQVNELGLTKYPDGGGTFNKSVNKKGNLKTSAEGYYAYINGVNLSNGGSPKTGWLNKYNKK